MKVLVPLEMNECGECKFLDGEMLFCGLTDYSTQIIILWNAIPENCPAKKYEIKPETIKASLDAALWPDKKLDL